MQYLANNKLTQFLRFHTRGKTRHLQPNNDTSQSVARSVLPPTPSRFCLKCGQPLKRRLVKGNCNDALQFFVQRWHVASKLPVLVMCLRGHALATIMGHPCEENAVSAARPVSEAPGSPIASETLRDEPFAEALEGGLQLPPGLSDSNHESPKGDQGPGLSAGE